MKIRVALLITAAGIGSLAVLHWWLHRRILWAIQTGWEFPAWFRFLLGVDAFCHHFWPAVLPIIVAIILLKTDWHSF